MNDSEYIAGEALSVGCAVTYSGTKWKYSGKLFKPWTWFKFEKAQVVVPSKIDHIAIAKD